MSYIKKHKQCYKAEYQEIKSTSICSQIGKKQNLLNALFSLANFLEFFLFYQVV